MLVVDENPEAAWQELAPYFLRELREYSGWKQAGVPRPGEEEVRTLDDLRAQERFTVLTAQEAGQRLAERESASAVVHPLAGGIPLDRAWKILVDFSQALLPASAPGDEALSP